MNNAPSWRAEMWLKSKKWLEDPAGVQIPDRDLLQADACGPTYGYDSHTRLILESKDSASAAFRARTNGTWSRLPSPNRWRATRDLLDSSAIRTPG